MQHDVGFEARNTGELLVADGAGEVRRVVCGLVQREVELHVERLRALVAAVRLRRGGRGCNVIAITQPNSSLASFPS